MCTNNDIQMVKESLFYSSREDLCVLLKTIATTTTSHLTTNEETKRDLEMLLNNFQHKARVLLIFLFYEFNEFSSVVKVSKHHETTIKNAQYNDAQKSGHL